MKTQNQYKPVIIRYPTGRWAYVGSLPIELCEKRKSVYGTDTWVPMNFPTYQEALDFAIEKGFNL